MATFNASRSFADDIFAERHPQTLLYSIIPYNRLTPETLGGIATNVSLEELNSAKGLENLNFPRTLDLSYISAGGYRVSDTVFSRTLSNVVFENGVPHTYTIPLQDTGNLLIPIPSFRRNTTCKGVWFRLALQLDASSTSSQGQGSGITRSVSAIVNFDVELLKVSATDVISVLTTTSDLYSVSFYTSNQNGGGATTGGIMFYDPIAGINNGYQAYGLGAYLKLSSAIELLPTERLVLRLRPHFSLQTSSNSYESTTYSVSGYLLDNVYTVSGSYAGPTSWTYVSQTSNTPTMGWRSLVGLILE